MDTYWYKYLTNSYMYNHNRKFLSFEEKAAETSQRRWKKKWKWCKKNSEKVHGLNRRTFFWSTLCICSAIGDGIPSPKFQVWRWRETNHRYACLGMVGFVKKLPLTTGWFHFVFRPEQNRKELPAAVGQLSAPWTQKRKDDTPRRETRVGTSCQMGK